MSLKHNQLPKAHSVLMPFQLSLQFHLQPRPWSHVFVLPFQKALRLWPEKCSSPYSSLPASPSTHSHPEFSEFPSSLLFSPPLSSPHRFLASPGSLTVSFPRVNTQNSPLQALPTPAQFHHLEPEATSGISYPGNSSPRTLHHPPVGVNELNQDSGGKHFSPDHQRLACKRSHHVPTGPL